MLSTLAVLFTLSAAPHGLAAPQVKVPVAVTSCAAVAKTRIESAIGSLLDGGAEEHSKFDSTCTYSAGEVAVTISIRHLTRELDLSAELGNLRDSIPGAKVHEVQVTGGRAFALEIPGAGTQLHLLPEGGEYVMVSVLGVGEAQKAALAAEKIARATLTGF